MKIYVYYDQSLDDDGYVCGIHVNLVTEKEEVWAEEHSYSTHCQVWENGKLVSDGWIV